MNIPKPLPTQARIVSLLNYDPGTGQFSWRGPHTNAVRNGQTAGSDCGSNGQVYRRIKVDNVAYKAHRLAWLYVYGACPERIDHIDGDQRNNRISNLRECSSSQNKANSRKPTNNTSGFKGVSWFARDGVWMSRIRHQGRLIHLGCFRSGEEAHSAYVRKATELFGNFAKSQ